MKHRNAAYNRWLVCGSASAKCAFTEARGLARQAVRKAKEDWLHMKADCVESARFSGHSAWNAIRDIQSCFAGLRPKSVQAICTSSGQLCTSIDEQRTRWHEHFCSVLNLKSTFDPNIFDSLCQRDVVDELAHHLSLDDVDQALKHLSNRKAAGQSAIAPEMLKTATPTIRPYLLDLLQTAWSTSCVPQDWCDALLVPSRRKVISAGVTTGGGLLCWMS